MRKLLLTCVPIAIALVLMQLRPLVINGLFPCSGEAEPEPEPEAEPEPTLDGDACAGRKRFFEGELNELGEEGVLTGDFLRQVEQRRRGAVQCILRQARRAFEQLRCDPRDI